MVSFNFVTFLNLICSYSKVVIIYSYGVLVYGALAIQCLSCAYCKVVFTFLLMEKQLDCPSQLKLGDNHFAVFPVQLLSARDMAQKTVIGQDRIVYSTDRDIIEQDVEAQEWDRRFREIEKSE